MSRDEYVLGPGPKPAQPTVQRPPDKHCRSCWGTGWIESIDERLPVRRCECMTREDGDDHGGQ